MSGVELGLAIIATVDLCLKYGKELVNLRASFKDAETQLAERSVRLENILVRTTYQLNFLKSIWQTLDETHQRLQSDVLDILVAKLKVALSRVEKLIPSTAEQTPNKVQRWRYALCKESLDKSLDDLEMWQKMFDPSWFLIMKATNSQIDVALSDANADSTRLAIRSASSIRTALRPEGEDKAKIFLPADGLELAHIIDIPLSTLKAAQRMGSSKWLVLDTVVQSEGGNPSIFAKDVRDIARKLRQTDPHTFRLLSCSGVVRHVDTRTGYPASFTFVFKMPEGLNSPVSLRNVLHSASLDHVLSQRFQIAKDLARAVSYVHNFGFVHKNIRPETILLLKDEVSNLGTPFLTGFEAFRLADGNTRRSGDTIWNLNIYRHPDRQGEKPLEDYVMQHDIYSLGVCLLELGLFTSFVVYDDNSVPVSASALLDLTPNDLRSANTSTVKDTFLSLAQNRLPRHMGKRYSDIVVTCLTCLDADNVDFGDEGDLLDEDGILVSVRYIEKILIQLDEICV